ncbi:THAP domain-containing protein 2 [Frankliniella fusca]|uniref:THAP domain-containing protein 2 n=1 Tax=Frankliniella fusca TaxID=407009 RepID=A0AAE1L567_9NEOP|nr:THAP domain-containing protein 2 [Frankliniella fusca]
METERCEVRNCQTTLEDCHAELRLLRFPDDARLPAWIEKVKGRGSSWAPEEHSRVCTRHFEISNFSVRKRCNQITKGAVPTLSLGMKAAHQVRPPLGSSTASAAMLVSGSHFLSPKASPMSTGQLFKHPSPLTESNSTKNPKSAVSNDSKGKNVARKRGQRYNPKANNVSAVLDYLNAGEQKEDDYLNQILLRKSVSGLISHVNELVKETTSLVKEMELRSMAFILLKIQKNLGLSAEDALVIFQQQVPLNVYSSLQNLIREKKSPFKALVRSFSLSLNFYSLPAYNHVRNMVNDALPHPCTIVAWYTTIDKYMH